MTDLKHLTEAERELLAGCLDALARMALCITRLTAEVERLTRERDELRKEKAGSVWPEGFDATDDASVELAVELVDRTRERDAARAEINRRKGDPITRLHNLTEGCEQTSGAYDADEFHRLDDEIKRLQRQLANARERADAAEAALARAQKVVEAARTVRACPGNLGDPITHELAASLLDLDLALAGLVKSDDITASGNALQRFSSDVENQ